MVDFSTIFKLEELFLQFGDDSTVAEAVVDAIKDNLVVRERYFGTLLFTSFKSMCKNWPSGQNLTFGDPSSE